jgi:hypothetical protein
MPCVRRWPKSGCTSSLMTWCASSCDGPFATVLSLLTWTPCPCSAGWQLRFLHPAATPCATRAWSVLLPSGARWSCLRRLSRLNLVSHHTSRPGRTASGRPHTALQYRPWAELMKRSFALDVETCPKCAARMKLRALVTKPSRIERFLRHLGEPIEAPPLSAARDPPYSRLARCGAPWASWTRPRVRSRRRGRCSEDRGAQPHPPCYSPQVAATRACAGSVPTARQLGRSCRCRPPISTIGGFATAPKRRSAPRPAAATTAIRSVDATEAPLVVLTRRPCCT